MNPNDNDDSNRSILTQNSSGQMLQIGVEHIKSAYIMDGSSAQELADKFFLPVAAIEKIISDNQLDKIRAAHIKHGLASLQSVQLAQAEKLMTLENQFKRIRIIQLEKILEDYLTYYSKNGHFYKVHPISGDILNDTNGIPIQIKLPNVAAELTQLKESFSLSEGLKQLLSQIDDIINTPKDVQPIDPNMIEMSGFDGLFQKKKSED